MKNPHYLFVIALVGFGFTFAPSPSKKPSISSPTALVQDFSVIGNWKVDTTYFINDGIKTDGAEPLFDARWIFANDGSCSLSNNPGTYRKEGDVLYINAMGMEQEYTIIEKSTTMMRVNSTIVETADMSMIMEAKLTRVE